MWNELGRSQTENKERGKKEKENEKHGFCGRRTLSMVSQEGRGVS
jgi:hypothetical protein